MRYYTVISLKQVPLRTVPPLLLRIYSAHLGMVRKIPVIQRFFSGAVYDYARKTDLSKGCWSPKKKLGRTTHFSELKSFNSDENSIHCSTES